MVAAFTLHEGHIAQQPEAVQTILRGIQAAVHRQVPTAIPVVSYGMPAFRERKVFFYFAAFKHHIGIYPPLKEDAELIEATQAFRNPKGNLKFPLDQPVPLDLIARIALALARQYGQ